jgi:hypothetical protein
VTRVAAGLARAPDGPRGTAAGTSDGRGSEVG